MASDTIKCPYCECKVKVSDIEKEDGICPECGQFVLAAGLGGEEENEDNDDGLNVMDREYEDDDSWNTPDDTEEPDFTDELNEDFDSLDEDGSPRTRRRRAGGMGFQAPQASSGSKKSTRGGKKK